MSETEYWKAVRMQLPDHSISRMMENMRENAIYAAETDYVNAGPQILTGYFKEESLRTILGNLIHADFDEIDRTLNVLSSL